MFTSKKTLIFWEQAPSLAIKTPEYLGSDSGSYSSFLLMQTVGADKDDSGNLVLLSTSGDPDCIPSSQLQLQSCPVLARRAHSE